MKLPYAHVSKKNPFLYVEADFDPTTIQTTGATNIQVYRVQKLAQYYTNYPPSPIAQYTPLESCKNKFTFVLDDQVFNQSGGRYVARFYYLGTFVGEVQFIYDKIQPYVVGSSHV